jgi:hypothetical protein
VTAPLRKLAAAVLLGSAAAAYFSLGIGLTIEWSDEGHMIYSSWRTAEGAIPYRDYQHLYGPSLFFLNGGLMAWFGADLAVVRLALVACKAVTAVLVYLLARAAAPRLVALAAYAAYVAIFGAPWWLFATPYSQHYVNALNLGGLLLLMTWRGRPALAGLAAGLCFGLSTTFKQTTGIFAAVAVAWFLLHRRDGTAAATPATLAERVVGWLVLAASLLVVAVYGSKEPQAWTMLVLLTPPLATAALLAWRESAIPPSRGDVRYAVTTLVACGLGLAVPVAVYVALYASLGSLDRMLDDLFRVLPWKMHWFTAFPAVDAPALAPLVTAAALLCGARLLAQRRFGTGAVFCALALVAGIGLMVWSKLASPMLNCTGFVFAAAYWFPIASVWLALPAVFAPSPAAAPEKREALALVYFYAVVSVLYLTPAADLMHVFTALPINLILLAHVAPRLWPASLGTRRPLVASVATALVVAALAPFVSALVSTRRELPEVRPGFARAGGVFDPRPKFRQAVELVDYLRDGAGRGRPVFVMANEQMLYFLAARHSPLERHEFLFFLAGFGLVAKEDARADLDEESAVGRLRETRPLIVDVPGTSASRFFRATFPRVTAYLDGAYHPVATFGAYRVLDAAP